MRGLIFILAGIVILGLGGWQFTRGFIGLTKAIESPGWPHTLGQVTSSRVKAESSHGRNGGTSYTPEITYSFNVADQIHRGDDPVPGRLWNSQSAYEAVGRFGSGQSVEVYYAASNPGESVLISGLHLATWGRLAFGTLILFMGALFVIAGIWVGFVMPPGVNTYSFPPGSAGPLILITVIGTLAGLTGAVYYLSRLAL
jgi:hypothetical protein